MGRWPAASDVSDIASASFTRPATVKKKLAPNACEMRKRLPRFMALETPSTPTAKYPRMALPFGCEASVSRKDDKGERERYVLAHEQSHSGRGDERRSRRKLSPRCPCGLGRQGAA